MKLLTIDNAKTSKGQKLGYLAGILYFAPAKISGFEVCPKRSAGCTAACLYTAGHGRFTYTQEARIRKTKFFFEQRQEFLAQLRKDIKALVKKAEKMNLKPAVRLNGTSDIEWIRFGIMEEFPSVQFYDYTKVLSRLTKTLPPNYHLTFSQHEDNNVDCKKALELGFNVATVMSVKKKEQLPPVVNSYPVFDGDETDLRFLDPKGGHIIGLRAKGDAKKDKNGFSISVN